MVCWVVSVHYHCRRFNGQNEPTCPSTSPPLPILPQSACNCLTHPIHPTCTLQLWSYYVAPDVHAPEQLVNEPVVFDAVRLMVDVWVTEQHHEELSPYRYSELPRDGLGSPVAYTGARPAARWLSCGQLHEQLTLRHMPCAHSKKKGPYLLELGTPFLAISSSLPPPPILQA